MYFFDLDGTLLDSNGVWLDIDIAFLGKLGVSPVPEDYTEYVTHHSFPASAQYTKERFQLELSWEKIAAAWQDMALAAYSGQLELKPGAKEFLLRARRAGVPCGLITSCMPHLTRAALERHGLAPLLDPVLIAGELGMEKRDPGLYRRLAAEAGLEPGDCVLFDDSPVYLAAAKEAGWRVYGVADPIFAGREEEFTALCGPEGCPFSFFSPLP